MNAITFQLPLPPKECSPNWRGHWAVKAKAVKAYRTLTAAVALTESDGDRPRWKRAMSQLRFFFRDQRARDADNLLASMKAAFDGLTDAGILADDAGLGHWPVQIAVVEGEPHVSVTIEKSREDHP